jgi:Mg2+-importing ATPase
MIRTPKLPFAQSNASWQVTLLTTCGILVGTLLPYTSVGRILDMAVLPGAYYLLLAATIIAYILLVTAVKKMYVRRYGELL